MNRKAEDIMAGAVETVIEAFDNHLCYDPDAEMWLNDGNRIVFKFSGTGVEVITTEKRI